MKDLSQIPVVVDSVPKDRPRSGEKYQTPQGFTAIRDGIKTRLEDSVAAGERRALAGKPRWLRAPLPAGAGDLAGRARALGRSLGLGAVEDEAALLEDALAGRAGAQGDGDQGQDGGERAADREREGLREPHGPAPGCMAPLFRLAGLGN